MRNKKSHLDILGESHIPSDLLTPTLGSNYGLDGFEDVQYGMGVLEGVLDPQFTEAPALPTGVQLGSAEDMDLNSMLEDETPLTDLTWLDPSQLQDPERLPEIPLSIPELEEAWGRSTDGVRVWERDLDKANYEESLEKEPLKKAKLTPEHIRRVVSHAMRRSVRGHNIDTITKEAFDSVGEEAANLKPYLKPLREEHGLAGNVFIRASAYPKWGTGKWAPEVRKYASKAKYIIASQEEIRSATWIEAGRCKYTSKLVVAEVPWAEALRHYKPLLESTGRKVASGDPKAVLRAAFLAIPAKKEISTENLPVHIAPSQRISSKEAREAFRNYKPEKVVYDPTPARQAALRERAVEKVERMVSAHQIPEADGARIIASGAPPEVMLRKAAGIASRVREGTYTDTNRAEHEAASLNSQRLDAQKAQAREAVERVSKYDAEKELSKDAKDRAMIARWVSANFVTQVEVGALLSELGSYPAVRDALQPRCNRLAAQIKKENYRGENRAQEDQILLASKTSEARRADSREAQARIQRTRPAEALDAKTRISNLESERSRGRIAQWVDKKLVSEREVRSILAQEGDYTKVEAFLKPQIVRVAAQIRKVGYSGLNRAVEAQEEVFGIRDAARVSAAAKASKEVSTEIARREKAVSMEARDKKPVQQRAAKVQEQISRGLRGSYLRSFFARSVPAAEASEVMRILGAKALQAFEDVVVESKTYDKTQFTRLASERKAKGVLAGQIVKASAWLRKTMTEGLAGKDLDDLITQRISESLRVAAGKKLGELRERHEGASGFFYVDAEVYASPTGVTGCEQGALKHRANKINTVAEMPRCATCAMVRVLEDGTRKCGVYNKALLSLEGTDLSEIKEANIRASNMTDAELTSSLFSPAYDPSEFGLHNDNLEGVSFEETSEKPQEVSFGDWDF